MSDASPATEARAVARACRTGSLASLMADGSGQPYASLVLVAFDHDASPLLLVSTLADHTKNMLADARVSLLCDGTAGYEDTLTGPRVNLLGRAEKSGEPRHRARFIARHPSAGMYAGFGDFAIWKITVERAHMVAGFGRIHWIEDFSYTGNGPALAEAEPDILAHMNADHADAVQLYATRLLGRDGDGWSLCGIDPEGGDLIRTTATGGRELTRLPFDHPVHDAESARAELVRLVKKARSL